MFTGLVQSMGCVVLVEERPFGAHLVVDRSGWEGYKAELGDSVCVSGVCLTVTEMEGETLGFDVVGETLAWTTLGSLVKGQRVNLEPSLTASTPMGGHFVQGHVDGVGRVDRVSDEGEGSRIRIELESVQASGDPEGLMEAVVPKGSVTVDGVSLTVASVGGLTFEVALIPTTLRETTLGEAKEGDRVNLETDMVSRTVVHWLRLRHGEGPSGGNVTMDTLRRAGFLDE